MFEKLFGKKIEASKDLEEEQDKIREQRMRERGVSEEEIREWKKNRKIEKKENIQARKESIEAQKTPQPGFSEKDIHEFVKERGNQEDMDKLMKKD